MLSKDLGSTVVKFASLVATRCPAATDTARCVVGGYLQVGRLPCLFEGYFSRHIKCYLKPVLVPMCMSIWEVSDIQAETRRPRTRS